MANERNNQHSLAECIFLANPYTRRAATARAAAPGAQADAGPVTGLTEAQNALKQFHQSMVPMTDSVERDSQLYQWTFKGQPRGVAASMRIPYTYEDEFGESQQQYLLIGFEGAPGY